MCKLYNKVDGIAPIGNLDNGIIPAETKLTITVDELAQQLNVSRATAYNLARRKDFYPAFRIGTSGNGLSIPGKQVLLLTVIKEFIFTVPRKKKSKKNSKRSKQKSPMEPMCQKLR